MNHYIFVFIIVILLLTFSKCIYKYKFESFQELPTVKLFYISNSTECEYAINEMKELKKLIKEGSFIKIKSINLTSNDNLKNKYNIDHVPIVIFEGFNETFFQYTGEIKAIDIFKFIKLRFPCLMES